MPAAYPAGPLSRSQRIALGCVVGAAAGVRLARAYLSDGIFNDGPVFLGLAQRIAASDWSAALDHPYHPLYPLAIVLAHGSIGEWEPAAIAVSVVSGAAATWLLFLFLRSSLGTTSAWLGSTLLAVHPRLVDWSSNVQSDGLYLALFLASVWLAWEAFQSRRPALAAGAGAASGLAYLVRPEGIGIVLVALLWVGLASLRRAWRAREGLAWGAALLAAAFLVALPYLLALRIDQGTWTLTHKKSVAKMLETLAPASGYVLDEGGREASTSEGSHAAQARSRGATEFASSRRLQGRKHTIRGRPIAALAELLDTLQSAVRPWFLVLLPLGIAARFGPPGPSGAFVLLVFAVYGLALYAQTLNSGYVSTRHVLPPFVVAFGYLAAGVEMLGSALARGIGFIRGAASPRRLGVGIATGVMLVAALAQALHTHDGALERSAAEWLRDPGREPGAVAATKERVGYYADRPFVCLRSAPREDLLPYLQERGVRYLVVDDEEVAWLEALGIAERLQVRHSVQSSDGRWSVLELPGPIAARGSRAPIFLSQEGAVAHPDRSPR